MNEHLFKLKKDGKVVGFEKRAQYRPSDDDLCIFSSYDGIQWFENELANGYNSAHPFVTEDKNGKDVFADDPVWLHWKGKKTKGEIIKEGLFWKYKNHEGYSRTLCKFDISHIELIEEKE